MSSTEYKIPMKREICEIEGKYERLPKIQHGKIKR